MGDLVETCRSVSLHRIDGVACLSTSEGPLVDDSRLGVVVVVAGNLSLTIVADVVQLVVLVPALESLRKRKFIP